jgi:pimeloyl-ACP methyl ester carboxylesterase
MPLYHEVAGTGPAVVLVHEGIADSRMWDRQFARWPGSFRVVRYDIAGFGRSPLRGGPFSHSRDLLELLDQLAIEKAALVGGSLGGRIALDTALAAPERVVALVLVAPGLPGWEWSEHVREFGEAEEAALEAGDMDSAVELNLRLWVDGPRRGPDAVDPAVRAFVGRMQRLAFENLEAAYAQDPPPGPEERPDGVPADVRAPTLLVVGDEDVPDMLAISERLERELPDARRVVMQGVAHVPSLERPDEFERIVLGFLRETLG